MAVGILLPFRFGPDGNPVTGSGEDLRSSRVGLTLGTTATGPRFAGEVPYDTEFGSRMEELRQQRFSDMLPHDATVYAADALEYAIPDEVLASDAVVTEESNGRIEISFVTQSAKDRGPVPAYAKSAVLVKK